MSGRGKTRRESNTIDQCRGRSLFVKDVSYAKYFNYFYLIVVSLLLVFSAIETTKGVILLVYTNTYELVA